MSSKIYQLVERLEDTASDPWLLVESDSIKRVVAFHYENRNIAKINKSISDDWLKKLVTYVTENPNPYSSFYEDVNDFFGFNLIKNKAVMTNEVEDYTDQPVLFLKSYRPKVEICQDNLLDYDYQWQFELQTNNGYRSIWIESPDEKLVFNENDLEFHALDKLSFYTHAAWAKWDKQYILKTWSDCDYMEYAELFDTLEELEDRVK